MRNEDLMVGDWFRFRYTIDGKEIVKTFRISRIVDDIGRVWGDGFGRMCKPERLEPIPLTPEILEKNGFIEKNAFADAIGIEIYGDESLSCGLSYDYEDAFIFETYKSWTKTAHDGSPEDWGFCSQDRIRNIRYVHDLQHCLKLVGIDKNIVL